MKNKYKSNFIRQLVLYGIVGGISFIADYGTLWGLTEYFHLHYLLSAAIAFILGLAINYVLSTKWVFLDRKYDSKWIEFIFFTVIGIVGLILNEILIYIVSSVLAKHYMTGKIISTIVVFFWNFLARKYLLFRKKD